MPGNATAELTPRPRPPRTQEDTAALTSPYPGITLSDEEAEGERSHFRRSVLEQSLPYGPPEARRTG